MSDPPIIDETTTDKAESSAASWTPSRPHIHNYKDAGALADAGAKMFLDAARAAIAKTDRFVVVLSGGSTPRGMYHRLTQPPYRTGVPWNKTYFVFSDERCVPPDDEQSNFRMAREALFDPLEIPAEHVVRMKGEQKPSDAALRYEVRLDDVFLCHPRKRFDLVLLGVGTDGHTASLFPGTAALDESQRWVVANEVPQLETCRLTMTFPALNSAKQVIFLATGEEKAQIIAEAFGGVDHGEAYPCERVLPVHARRDVLLDEAAASRIPAAKASTASDTDAD